MEKYIVTEEDMKLYNIFNSVKEKKLKTSSFYFKYKL